MKPSISSLKKKLDAVFSEFIRRRDKGRCFTCGKFAHWKKMQNGHFISRSHNNTRYDEVNCRCQCVGCNVFKYGNMPLFAQKLLKELGEKGFNDLVKQGKKFRQFTIIELQELIEHYKRKIKNIDKNRPF